MPDRRDKRGRWFFRTVVKLPDGTTDRISGTPGRPGPYHDLAQSRVGAQEAERRAIATAMSGERVKPAAARGEVPTLGEYKDTFLDNCAAAHKPSAQRAKRSIIRHHLEPFFGHVRLDAIRQEDVDRLVAHLLKSGRTRKTVNNVTAVLSSILRYAAKDKIIRGVDLKFAIKAQSAEIVAVSAEDVEKLVTVANPRWRAAILLACDAGLRVGEVRALKWTDVNMIGREVTVARSLDSHNSLTETKGWERRTVPMSDRLWAALKALPTNTSHVVSAMRYVVARKTIHHLYREAEVAVPVKPWHALRHTFCSELARRGVPVNVIKELAWHKSIETTLRYMHTDRAAKRAAIDALAANGSEGRRGDVSR